MACDHRINGRLLPIHTEGLHLPPIVAGTFEQLRCSLVRHRDTPLVHIENSAQKHLQARLAPRMVEVKAADAVRVTYIAVKALQVHKKAQGI